MHRKKILLALLYSWLIWIKICSSMKHFKVWIKYLEFHFLFRTHSSFFRGSCMKLQQEIWHYCPNNILYDNLRMLCVVSLSHRSRMECQYTLSKYGIYSTVRYYLLYVCVDEKRIHLFVLIPFTIYIHGIDLTVLVPGVFVGVSVLVSSTKKVLIQCTYY